jgi:single-stranded DNA-specific DHH superfamily exonuclease
MKDPFPAKAARKLLAAYDEFFLGLTRKDRVAVMHDKDPDGICAGVILAKQVQRMRGRKIDLRVNVPGSAYLPTPAIAKRLKRRRINKVIITDISADNEPGFVRKVARFAQVIIIDHHKIYSKFKEKNVILVKPQLLQKKVLPSAYCSSKFAYDLGNRLVNLTDMDWLAATGSIADIAAAPWMRWLSSVHKRHKVAMRKDLFTTRIGQTATVINSALVYDLRNVPFAFKTVFNAKKPAEVLKSPLRRYHEEVQGELDKWVRLLDRKAEHHPEHEMIVYYIEPKLHIKSTLSTVLSLKYKHTTLILLSPVGNMITVSARRHDQKVAMNTLLECSCKGLKGSSAGGHIPAAGGRFKRSDLLRFRSQLLDCIARARKSS